MSLCNDFINYNKGREASSPTFDCLHVFSRCNGTLAPTIDRNNSPDGINRRLIACTEQHHINITLTFLSDADNTHLVTPGVEIHDKVLGLGVPVPDLALVAVGVPGHALRHVSVVLVLGDQLVILVSLRAWSILQGLPQDHRGLARPEMSSSYPRALCAKVSDIFTAKPSICNIFIASLYFYQYFSSLFSPPTL